MLYNPVGIEYKTRVYLVPANIGLKMWVMTRIEFFREVPLRNPSRAPEYTGRTNAKTEIEFQERARSLNPHVRNGEDRRSGILTLLL